MKALFGESPQPVAAQIPIAEVKKVEFYKINELTTDLICCHVSLVGGKSILIHEDMDGWDRQIQRLTNLTAFDSDWFAKVSQPPFAPSNHVAFEAKL